VIFEPTLRWERNVFYNTYREYRIKYLVSSQVTAQLIAPTGDWIGRRNHYVVRDSLVAIWPAPFGAPTSILINVYHIGDRIARWTKISFGPTPEPVTITNDPPVSVQVSAYGWRRVRAENLPWTGVHEPSIANDNDPAAVRRTRSAALVRKLNGSLLSFFSVQKLQCYLLVLREKI
jgi:hypothetical protein